MGNIARDGTAPILASVDRAEDGTPQRLILSIDLTTPPVMSKTECSKLYATTGGLYDLKIKGFSDTAKIGLNFFDPIPESDLSESAKAHKEAARAALKARMGKGRRQAEEL